MTLSDLPSHPHEPVATLLDLWYILLDHVLELLLVDIIVALLLLSLLLERCLGRPRATPGGRWVVPVSLVTGTVSIFLLHSADQFCFVAGPLFSAELVE